MWIKGRKRSDIILVLKNHKVPKDEIRKILRFLEELKDSPATASIYLANNFGLEIEEAKKILGPILIAQNEQTVRNSKRNIGYGSLWVLVGIIATIYLPLDILYYALMFYGVVRIVKGIIQFGNG